MEITTPGFESDRGGVQENAGSAKRLKVERYFTKDGQDVFDVEWERRDATIKAPDGTTKFEQKDVEFPRAWSQMATNVTTEKYFRGKLNTPQRETSVRQIVHRVAETIATWGVEGGYFAEEDRGKFYDELAHLLLHQKAAFNSPVWFNLGVEDPPQVSACYIQSIDDSMEGIMNLASSEVMLFKYGSGTGTNISTLRSAKEQLSGGGYSSGPVSFMRGFDSFAGVIRSGGKTRRAAKMVIMDVDHPDILEFVRCKVEEEKKAHALIAAGWPANLAEPGSAYETIQYQNANHTIRVTDKFMKQVIANGSWQTRARLTDEVMSEIPARDIFREVAEAAHFCGDPGMQFDTEINRWNTCSNSGRINASNPCSEYMHLDDSACNLGSLNLRKFESENGKGPFDVEGFVKAAELMLLAQEIMIDNARYPTPAIAAGAAKFRQLGLGYANLGALLMAQGLPYDSEEGRDFAAAITSLMQAAAYRKSAEIASVVGPYEGFKENMEPQLRVIEMHATEHQKLYGGEKRQRTKHLLEAADKAWDEAVALSGDVGVRNSQVSLLAPTGTIAFLMDCDTTGVEPELALVKYKKLVGGGQMKIVNQTVERALLKLGYSVEQTSTICKWIDKEGTIESCPEIKAEHLPIFDCSFRPTKGKRCIDPAGHIKMMAAVQPFLSGAISKTVNVDNDTTVEEFERLYKQAWNLKIKALAIYRDGCKKTQPLNTTKTQATQSRQSPREKMTDTGPAVRHKFRVANRKGYLHVGEYEDGRPAEIFITMAKQGSSMSGLMDAVAVSVSIGLQHGVPLKTFIAKFSHTRFEPAGLTGNRDIPMAKSILDYIFRWLEREYEKPEVAEDRTGDDALTASGLDMGFQNQADAPPCPECESLNVVRNGSCYRCHDCGASLGCS